MVVLIVAPLVLPIFWAKFLTEILIWGLLALSSDLLIGYTGMISFGIRRSSASACTARPARF
jgi:branched-chain amino acid transport system permease protein